jgi:hypothetical protein
MITYPHRSLTPNRLDGTEQNEYLKESFRYVEVAYILLFSGNVVDRHEKRYEVILPRMYLMETVSGFCISFSRRTQ